jgi:hypothetical protein
MVRAGVGVIVVGLVLTPAVPAQTAPWQFHLPAGQALNYRVEQTTSWAEVVGGTKRTTSTKLGLVKRWQNLGPDKGKPGTRLVLTLVSLRIEVTKDSGEVLRFDSDKPDQGTPELRDYLSRQIGQPMAVLRMDGSGRVLEVIECKQGPAGQFESQLPFVLLLPDKAPRVGDQWSRAYQVTLQPPQGTGEKFAAVQKYACKAIREGKATVAVSTRIDPLPASPLDRVPLLQVQPEGEAVFDIAAGRLLSARLRIDQELKNHQGEGSSCHFQNDYSEQYLGGN